MKKAFIYARTSTKRQQQETRQSIDSQISLAKAFLVNHPEYELQDTIIDAASAFKGSHLESDAGLGQFLMEAEKGEHVDELLIVVYTDRLTRLPIDDAFALLKRLALAKVNLAITSLGQFIRYNDPLEFGLRMTLTALFHLSHSDSSIKSARVRAAFEERLEKIKAGTHKKSKGLPAWIKLVDGEYVINETAKETIQWIFEQKKKGIGFYTIVKALIEEGKEPLLNRGWSLSYVTFLVKNVATYGAYQPQTSYYEVNAEGRKVRKTRNVGEPIEGYFPACVTKETFEAAEHSIQLAPTKGRRATTPNPFRGLLRCNFCGGSMVINTSSNVYLRCQRSRDGVSLAICKESNRVRFDMISERIMKAVASLNLKSIESARPKQQAIKARIAKIEKLQERQRLIIDTVDDDRESDAAMGKLKAYIAEKKVLEKELLLALSSTPTLDVEVLKADPEVLNVALLEVFEYIKIDKRFMKFKLRGFFGNDWEELEIDWNSRDIEDDVAEQLEFMQTISEFKETNL